MQEAFPSYATSEKNIALLSQAVAAKTATKRKAAAQKKFSIIQLNVVEHTFSIHSLSEEQFGEQIAEPLSAEPSKTIIRLGSAYILLQPISIELGNQQHNLSWGTRIYGRAIQQQTYRTYSSPSLRYLVSIPTAFKQHYMNNTVLFASPSITELAGDYAYNIANAKMREGHAVYDHTDAIASISANIAAYTPTATDVANSILDFPEFVNIAETFSEPTFKGLISFLQTELELTQILSTIVENFDTTALKCQKIFNKSPLKEISPHTIHEFDDPKPKSDYIMPAYTIIKNLVATPAYKLYLESIKTIYQQTCVLRQVLENAAALTSQRINKLSVYMEKEHLGQEITNATRATLSILLGVNLLQQNKEIRFVDLIKQNSGSYSFLYTLTPNASEQTINTKIIQSICKGYSDNVTMSLSHRLYKLWLKFHKLPDDLTLYGSADIQQNGLDELILSPATSKTIMMLLPPETMLKTDHRFTAEMPSQQDDRPRHQFAQDSRTTVQLGNFLVTVSQAELEKLTNSFRRKN